MSPSEKMSPCYLDPAEDALRFWIVPPTGEPKPIAPNYLRKNLRGARIISLRPVTHQSERLGRVTTSLFVTLSDAREVLIQSTRFWAHLAADGSPELQAEADRLMLSALRAKKRS